MNTFKTFIKEAIVEVDEKYVEFLLAAFMLEFFDIVKSNFPNKDISEKEKHFEEIYNRLGKDIDHVAKKFGQAKIQISLEVISDKYNLDYPLWFKTYAKEDNTGGGYSPENNAIYINMFDNRFRQLVDVWLQGDEHMFWTIVDEKREDVEHELMHSMQTRIRKLKKAKPLHVKNTYSSDVSAYMTSPVEVEQQIFNLVNKVITVMKRLDRIGDPVRRDQIDDILKAITKQPFTGDVPLNFMNIDTTLLSSFKKIAPAKYKNVIKNFYIEFYKRLEKDDSFIKS